MEGFLNINKIINSSFLVRLGPKRAHLYSANLLPNILMLRSGVDLVSHLNPLPLAALFPIRVALETTIHAIVAGITQIEIILG